MVIVQMSPISRHFMVLLKFRSVGRRNRENETNWEKDE